MDEFIKGITLGDVAIVVAFLVALFAGIKALKKDIKEWIKDATKEQFDEVKKASKEQFDDIKRDIAAIKSEQSNIDLENCKNYLVTFLSELERGEPKDEIEYQRFWEEYEHYISKGGNTYIKHRVDLLKASNKL